MALTCIKRGIPIVCAALLALAATAHAELTDAELFAARDAVQKSQWKVLDALRPRFAGALLEAYPTFWLLDGTLDRADPHDVQEFLARYPSGPLAEALRRDWLKVLGAQQSWDLFRAEHPRLLADDPDIACYAFQERLARNDPEAEPEARALFREAQDDPAACDPVYAALAASGALKPEETWARLRRQLAAGRVRQAKHTAALLEPAVRPSERDMDRAASDPARFLTRFNARHPDRAERELAIFAIARLAARNQADEAASRLQDLSARLGDDVPYAWSQLAWQAAMNLDPRSLEWYSHCIGYTLDDAQAAWKARAALRALDWKQLAQAVSELSPQEARSPAWTYWRARALRAQGDATSADALLRPLAAQTHFYGLLAAEELQTPAALQWRVFQPGAAELEEVRSMPGVRRALELYRIGMDADAMREWGWAVRDLDDRHLIAAAEIAAAAGVTDRAIFAADRTRQVHDYSRRYPMPHREALDAASRQWDLDEAFVYAIIRQESRFHTQARSTAGAVGLMQLMPGTARWAARQIAMKPFRADMLVQPDVNVAVGTYYLKRVLDSVGDSLVAAAAYNAGPTRARRWRDAKPLEGAIYAETIPYPETRDYVKKVFTNAWYYSHRLTGSASLHRMLGTVPPQDADSIAANLP